MPYPLIKTTNRDIILTGKESIILKLTFLLFANYYNVNYSIGGNILNYDFIISGLYVNSSYILIFNKFILKYYNFFNID